MAESQSRTQAIRQELQRRRAEAIQQELARRQAVAAGAQGIPTRAQVPGPIPAMPAQPVAPPQMAAARTAQSPPPAQPGFMEQIGSVIGGLTGASDVAAQMPEGVRQAGRIASEVSGARYAPEAAQMVTGGSEGIASTGGEFAGRKAGAAAGAALAPFLGPFAPLGMPAGAIIGGGIGAAGGLLASRLASGEQVDIGDLALEFGMSTVPGAAIEGVTAGGRKLLSRTRTGVESASTALGEQGRDIATKVLKPASAQAEDVIWTAVRNSGFQVAPSSFRKGVRTLSDPQFKVVTRAMRKIGSGPNDQFPRIGERAAEAFDAIRHGKPAPGMDIGALNHLRSQLTEQMLGSKGSQREALSNFIQTLDDGISSGDVLRQGVTYDGKTGRELLQAARDMSRTIRDHQNVMALVDNHVIKQTPDLSGYTIDLRPLVAALDPSSNIKLSKVGQAAAEALKRNRTLKSELEHFISVVDKVGIKPGALSRIEIIDAVTSFLADPAARERVKRIALMKRGALTAEDLLVAGVAQARTVGREMRKSGRSERQRTPAGRGYAPGGRQTAPVR